MGQQGKLLECQFQLTHGAVVFQVVVVDVQNHADRAGQMQKRLVVLAGFNDHTAAAAGLAVAADKGQLAADDGSRVLARQLQHGGDHAGGGGFAVGAGDTDALDIGTADIAQQNAALHCLDAALTGCFQFGVVVVDGGTVHDQVGVAQVGGIVADMHRYTQGALRFGVVGLLHIRAGDGDTAAVQDLDQGVGTGAAAADKVHGFYAVQQGGIKHGIHHWDVTSKNQHPIRAQF